MDLMGVLLASMHPCAPPEPAGSDPAAPSAAFAALLATLAPAPPPPGAPPASAEQPAPTSTTTRTSTCTSPSVASISLVLDSAPSPTSPPPTPALASIVPSSPSPSLVPVPSKVPRAELPAGSQGPTVAPRLSLVDDRTPAVAKGARDEVTPDDTPASMERTTIAPLLDRARFAHVDPTPIEPTDRPLPASSPTPSEPVGPTVPDAADADPTDPSASVPPELAPAAPTPLDRPRHAATPATSATPATPAAGATPAAPATPTTPLEATRPARPAPPAGVPTMGPAPRLLSAPRTTPLQPAPPTPSGPAPEATVARQLVERIGTLRDRGNGDYEVALHLEPAELGRVELRMRMESGVVHVHVATPSPETAAAVHRSLDDLRSLLLDAGLTPGALDVDSPGHQATHRGGHDRSGGDAGHGAADPAHASSTRPPRFVRSVVDATRAVDVLL